MIQYLHQERKTAQFLPKENSNDKSTHFAKLDSEYFKMLDTDYKTEFTSTDVKASRRYRKRSYYNRILSNEQTDCEEHSVHSKKLKETNGRMQTEQLDAWLKQMSEAQSTTKPVKILNDIEILPKVISTGINRMFSSDMDKVSNSSMLENLKLKDSFDRTTYLSTNNNSDKLTHGLKIKPCWYNSHTNNTLAQSTTFDYRNKSRCSDRFKDDVVLNTADFTVSYTNQLSQWQRDSSHSSNTFASPELKNFFGKYSQKQYLSEEPKWENDIPKISHSIYPENSCNCFNASSPLESLSTEAAASSKFTQEKKKKYIQTSLLRYFKQNKSLKTIGGCSRLHENIAKRSIKPIKNSMLTSATWKGSCFIGTSINRRTATKDLAIPKIDPENNIFSKFQFFGKPVIKRPPSLSPRKQTEYSKCHNSLDKLDSSLFKNKYSSVGIPEKVENNSIEPLLVDKIKRDLQINIRSDSWKMQTNLISSEEFCKSVSFKSPVELKASTNLELNSQNSQRSTDIVEQKKVNILRELYTNTLDRPCQETNSAKPLAESNMNFQGKGKGSYFWSTIRCHSKVLKAEQSNKFGYPHTGKKNATYDIANKENLAFRKKRFFTSILNTRLNSIESKDDTLNIDAQDTVRLIHNANNVGDTNCLGTTNLILQVQGESPVKENNDLVVGKLSMELNCQSVICCKNDIQSTSQIMSKSQTNMEEITPSSHSRNNLNNPSSLDNETLRTLHRIHESNKWKVNSAAVSTAHIPDNIPVPNLISKNATKPLRKLDQIESDYEKNVDVRLFRNVAPLQCTHETAKSLVMPPNLQYLNLNQNKSNDRVKENDTSKNNENKLLCPQEFADDLYDFASQQTLTQTQQTYAETNSIFCSQNDCFTQSQSILRNSQEYGGAWINSKTGRTVNWAPSSILYEDNLLKQLLDEKSDIIKSYNKRKSNEKQLGNQDGIMAKTYIKKYRKNNIHIYKIKRRLRTSVEERYIPKEHKLINKFLSQVESDSTNELLNENENTDSITTSSSYLTDETSPDDLSSDTKNLTAYQKFLANSINRILKDKSFVFSKFSDTASPEIDSSDVLTKIEEIMIQLLSDYECGKNISFNIPVTSMSNCMFRDDRYQLVDLTRRWNVHWHSPFQRRRFNLILFILNKIRILLDTNTKLTKREIYYQLKADVCTQEQTDRAIGAISRMLNVGIWALNITAQKGLVYGNIKLVMDTGETINCNAAGTLVPNDVMNICEVQSQAFFILVVEKESIFNKLLEEDLPNKLTKPFILITGKGYPDLNTQLLLKKLWMVMEIPVFIFVDADPDGIAIMLTYRFGSKTNVHVSEYLAIPKAKWIGVFPTEILNLGINYEILNKREIRKATSLLQLQCVQENSKIQKQIQTCLDTGVKASIEALMKSESYLSNQYLPSKFWKNDLI